MMYQSLYRRYRPQTFNEIYGQDAISTTLTNAIKFDRVAHAYLFSGPRGTGKTSTAKLLAKALNCTNIVDGRICDECENCQLIKNNAHPDVVEIDAASNNGVDEVRELNEKVKYAPIKGSKKVYIIDEIHMMSQGAFNALLKTLEEPPEHVVFILATTEHHKVLATIKSRCQRFNFKKLSDYDIVARLEDILKSENAEYDVKALKIIASQSDGGMRDAIGMLEQTLIYSNNNVTITAVNEALDLISNDKIKDLYNLIVSKKLHEVLEYLDSLSKSSIDYKQVINEIIELAIENIIELKVNHDQDDKQKFLLNLIEKFDEANEKLKFDNSKRLYIELAIIKTINYQKNISEIKESITRPTRISSKVEEKIIAQEDVVVTRKVFDDEYASNTNQEILEDNQVNNNIQPNTIITSQAQTLFNETNEEVEEDLNIIDDNQVSMFSLDEDNTRNEVVVNNKILQIADDEIINVLVQLTTSKEQLSRIKDKWATFDEYLLNKNTKQAAALLIDSTPVAACQEAIVVVPNENLNVELINNLESIQINADFFSSILDGPRYVLAIDKVGWSRVVALYKRLIATNSLPNPKDILEHHQFDEVEKKEDEILEDNANLSFAKMIFKDKLEIKSEE